MFQTLTLTLPSSSSSPSLFSASNYTSPKSHRRMSVACRARIQSFAEPISSSFYEVLRVKHNASPMEIKAAYRSLAKIYHPDVVSEPEGEGGRDFVEIHNAYETLSDPTARAVYDMALGLSRRERRLAGPASSVGCYSIGRRPGFYPTRRWETDQCW